MKRRLITDNIAQSALFDAVIFLIIMIIASSIVTVFADQVSKNTALSERSDMVRYAKDTSEVVFGATLNSTWYEDEDGNIIFRPPGNTKVMNLVLEELYLLDSGLPKENFALGYERDISILILNLVTSGYHFALMGTFNNPQSNRHNTVFISDIVPEYSSKGEAISDTTDYSKEIPRNNLASVQYNQPMIGKDGEAELTFLLWR